MSQHRETTSSQRIQRERFLRGGEFLLFGSFHTFHLNYFFAFDIAELKQMLGRGCMFMCSISRFEVLVASVLVVKRAVMKMKKKRGQEERSSEGCLIQLESFFVSRFVFLRFGWFHPPRCFYVEKDEIVTDSWCGSEVSFPSQTNSHSQAIHTTAHYLYKFFPTACRRARRHQQHYFYFKSWAERLSQREHGFKSSFASTSRA